MATRDENGENTLSIDLPPSISSAIRSCTRELGEVESWALPLSKFGNRAPERLAAILDKAEKHLDHRGNSWRLVRENIPSVLAYMTTDSRMRCVMMLARRNPIAFNDIISSDCEDRGRRHRFNIIMSLGVFSRHGLVSEVFERRRVNTVSQILRQQRVAGDQHDGDHG